MPKYTTATSDKKKKTALKWWAIGFLGLFGVENFYVGKIKKGIIRFIVGIFILLSLYAIGGDFEGRVPVCIVFWAIAALPNFFKIVMGVFRDNVGEPLRE